MIIDLPSPIAIICHDAGATNHIAAWVKKQGIDDSIRAYMEGPADKVWNSIFPSGTNLSSVEEAIRGAKSLLSGTGWASVLEHNARILAQRGGLHTVAMVDHWVNYETRFIRNEVKILPDEIWVVDEYAYRIASSIFDGCSIRLKPDVYSQSLVEKLRPVSELSNNELLYILEPMRTDWGKGHAGEFQALDFMLDHLTRLKLPSDTLIRLRPHPSDPQDKYEHYLSSSTYHQIIMDKGDLSEALSRAKWVAGCESFALTLALKAGRTVFCTLPPWAPACRLPHAGLVHLKDL